MDIFISPEQIWQSNCNSEIIIATMGLDTDILNQLTGDVMEYCLRCQRFDKEFIDDKSEIVVFESLYDFLEEEYGNSDGFASGEQVPVFEAVICLTNVLSEISTQLVKVFSRIDMEALMKENDRQDDFYIQFEPTETDLLCYKVVNLNDEERILS